MRISTIRVLIALLALSVGIGAAVGPFDPQHKSGSEAARNRKRLLEALKVCANKPYPEAGECTYLVAGDLMELCRKGDFSLLTPLFDMSRKADGALSESLGVFYSDMLYQHPEQFLRALSRYNKAQQRDLCSAAGVEDGGGMSDERFRQIHQSLKDVSDKSLRRVARNCSLGLETGYSQARKLRSQ